jgi:putative ABC transport system permease protein
MSDQNFRRFFSPRPLTQINLGLIQLDPTADPSRVIAHMRERLPGDVNILTKAEIIIHDRRFWIETTAIGFIFGLGVVVSFVVGTVIVYQILYTDIRDHMQEYATLKAMGYSSLYLFQLVLQQALLLAALGYLPGFVISLGLYRLTVNATDGSLPVSMNMGRMVFVLVITVVMCSVSGLISVRRAVMADPAEVFQG